MTFDQLYRLSLIALNLLCASVAVANSVVPIQESLLGEGLLDMLEPLSPILQETTQYDLASVFNNISQQINPIKNFIIAISYGVGLGLCVIAVMKLKKYGTKTAYMHVESSLVGPFLQFFIGIALFYLPTFVETVNITLWNEAYVYNSPLNYTSQTSSTTFEEYIEPILGVIQIIGMISFIRGWVMLSKATNVGQQPGAVSKGLTHVIGGIMGINIYTVMEVFNQTFLGPGTT
jgi:intracellular multiplication protein IcmC